MAGVIVEGVDGSGKTTLIKYLRNRTFWPVCHVVQPHQPNVTQMFELAACAPMIFDRFHLSPVAYGKALRSGPELGPYDLWGIEGFLMGRGYITIWCNTQPRLMVQNNRKEEQLWEEVRDLEKMKTLISCYQEALHASELPYTLYDYLVDDPENVISAASVVPALPLGLVGASKPLTWVVGDEKQQTREGVMEYVPFFTPGVGHQLLSGTLLQRSMAKINWRWQWTTLSNSAINGAVAPLREWYELLGKPKRVVALGGEAAERLDRAEIPNHRVTHPQAKRRFAHRTCEADYPEELKHATL